MSGHSKWASIKHKKATTDAKRGKFFSRMSKEIAVAARMGGGDPSGNPRLRMAMDKARDANMPGDNIKRAIMKGTGELPGTTYDEILYEGYGPSGVAVLIETLTDNKNRTVGEIRHLMTKCGGNLGEAGSVSWIFEKCGYVLVSKSATDEDTLMSVVLDAGATDLKNDDGESSFEVITESDGMEAVRDAVKDAGIEIEMAEVTMLPKNYIELEGKQAEQMTRLMESLEEQDDVQNIYANFNISDSDLTEQS